MAASEYTTPFDMVVFGGSGDLTRRKLVPALFHRDMDGILPPGRIIGVGRRDMDRAAYVDSLQGKCRRLDDGEVCPIEPWQSFAERLDFARLDATDVSTYPTLREHLHDDRIRVFYLATSPKLFGEICANLRDAELITAQSRVVLEKPLGRDLASAREINESVGEAFAEEQVFRIDHYLGKETVQNLMALRFGNALLEPLWGSAMIDHVQITVAERLGVEGRGGYYDGSGALRDMIQNHILQLLCLVAMEPPTSLDPDTMRDEKVKILRALRPVVAADAAATTVRGQYRAGAVGGAAVPGYLEEEGVAPDSVTETFVALKVDIDNWRWAGVPFYLRTGKRLAERVSEIIVQFKEVPHFIFDGGSSQSSANRLIIRLQPDERIQLLMQAKEPGRGMSLRPVHLNLSFAEAFKGRQLDAYERLLMDVIRGDPTLFMRRDEVEAAWRWTGPILDGWQGSDKRPSSYVAGTWGPSSAIALIERDGRTWHEEDA